VTAITVSYMFLAVPVTAVYLGECRRCPSGRLDPHFSRGEPCPDHSENWR
jgi:hypothetical protein